MASLADARKDGDALGRRPWRGKAANRENESQEAGGFVTDFRGGDRAIERNEFLAANDAMHSKLHKMVAQALR